MKGSPAGFSLVEVLVAISLMALVIAGLASMGVNSIQADTHSRLQGAAAVLAQNKLDELHILRRTDPAWAAGEHSEYAFDCDKAPSCEEGGTEYLREWEVQTKYNNYNRLSRVTVTVSWDNGSVSFSSLYW